MNTLCVQILFLSLKSLSNAKRAKRDKWYGNLTVMQKKARMLRSDVKSIKNEPQYKLVIATDELIGKICKTKRIDVINVSLSSSI